MTETVESSPSQTKVYVSHRTEKDGILTFTLTNVDVSMKNIRSKNTISVIEDMLKLGLILF